MLQINQTVNPHNNLPVYEFESRGTEYTVLDDGNGQTFTVFSNRKNCNFPSQIAVMTLKQMSKRAKVLKHLASLISS